MNYINYINYISFKSQKLPAMVLAWENLRGFLWCWLSSSFCRCSSFVVFLHSHFLFDVIPHPSVDYRHVFRPILYFQHSPSKSDSRHFHFEPFRYILTASATVLSGHFLPPSVFYLTLLPEIFGTPAFIKASLGTGSYSLKFADLHTDPRNTDPAHLYFWFTVIHNLLYILNLYLYISILQKFFIVVKTLIKKYRSAAINFK